MSEYRRVTRSVKHDKRQKQKRKILFFSSLSVVFLIVFVSLIVFGNKGNPKEAGVETLEDETEEPAENENIDEKADDDSSPKDTTIEPEEEENEASSSDVTVEEIPSEDENVITAFRGDWDPVGTKQEGPHTTNYNDGSDDRNEIKQAVVMVTGLDADDMIEHWIGRGGDQAVVATVSDGALEEYYRVYLQWVDEKGWQPTKAEKLKQL